MARGRQRKGRKKDKKHHKNFKLKNPKNKKKENARDIKHTDQYAQYKLRINNEKKKKVIEEEESDPEETVEDSYTLLLSTFKKDKDAADNVAIDSDDSSEEEMEVEENYVLEHGVNGKSTNSDSRVEGTAKENDVESEEEEKGEENLTDEEDEIDISNEEDIQSEANNPFDIHLNYDLDESLLESVSSNPMKVKSSKLYWPVLHNLKVEIPVCANNKPETANKVTIEGDIEYAKEYNPPVLIQSVEWNKLHVKSQIQNNLIKANKKHANVSCDTLTQFQKELFSIINNYQDLLYCERTLENGEEIRFVYCLHAVNHILKTRLKILHHNDRLFKKSKEQVPDEFRDQGLVRPKIVIVVPFRESCLRIVNTICSILLQSDKGNIINKSRFLEEFSGSELIMPKKNPKPEDYEQLFKGNIDDNFRIGLSVTKKSVKLYSDFYSSDIIIGSPLGLRMVIGAEGDKERDFDFLSSIELIILDQADIFLMQNWDHLLLIFEHLHVQPRESHGTDFSRVRSWALNGWTKFYRQTVIFSSIQFSELNAIYNRRCFNYAGKIRVINPVEDSSICRVVVPLSHVFQKFKADSAIESLDARFQLFTEKIIPQYKDPVMSGVLIYVPSYFDYVRIRNYLKKEDYNFVQICEYSKDAKVARARDMFFHNEAKLLLYSERFHFFRRITLKGIRHVIFYQPPTFPHFYSEICNLMQEGNQNRFLANDSGMTVTVLYCKYDVHQLSAIVKTSRAAKMVASEKDVHMFSTGRTEGGRKPGAERFVPNLVRVGQLFEDARKGKQRTPLVREAAGSTHGEESSLCFLSAHGGENLSFELTSSFLMSACLRSETEGIPESRSGRGLESVHPLEDDSQARDRLYRLPGVPVSS